MNANKKTKSKSDEVHEDERELADAPEHTADEQDTETLIEIPADEYESLKRETQELKERLIRQQADFDNTRKRLRKNAEESGNRMLAGFVRPLIVELDNFEHALKAAHPDRFQDFATGVSMIHQNITAVFDQSGIQAVPCEGVFDPAWHEVCQEIEDDSVPRGTILEVLRSGYRLGDQVIRAAQVVVAKPPAQAAPETDTAEESAAEES